MNKQGLGVKDVDGGLDEQKAGFKMELKTRRIRWGNFIAAAVICVHCMIAGQAQAKPRPAIPPLPERYLNHWDFDNTNLFSAKWTNTLFHENIALVDSWSEYALSMAGNQASLFAFPGIDASGHTNITPLAGSIRFWFKPSWTSGDIGQFDGRLFEAASWTATQSHSWWSLQFGSNGESISFIAQDGDNKVEMLSAPIQWQADEWHQIALIYSPQGSWLVLDGQFAAQGPSAALTPLAGNQGVFGVCIGSDSTGRNLAQGQFEELTTFNYPLGALEVTWNYTALAPIAALGAITPVEESARLISKAATRAARAGGNQMMLQLSGPPSPGDGEGGSDTNGPSNFAPYIGVGLKLTNVFLSGTNFMAKVADGTNGLIYDLFTCTNLTGNSITNSDWFWLGQLTNTQTFTITGIPFTNAFFVLGTPLDGDGDGLTDAYEHLASKTRSDLADSDGDGLDDAWEYANGMNPKLDESDISVQNTYRRIFTYDAIGRVQQVTGRNSTTVNYDKEGNITSVRR